VISPTLRAGAFASHPRSNFAVAGWDQGYGDLHIVVDMRTLRQTPWAPGTAIVLGDLQHESGGIVASDGGRLRASRGMATSPTSCAAWAR
jgi:glutamine synthetase